MQAAFAGMGKQPALNYLNKQKFYFTHMTKPLSLIISLLGLAACATSPQSAPPIVQAASVPTSIPYPEPTQAEQINQLAIQVARLEQQIAVLTEQLNQHETKHHSCNTSRNQTKQPAPKRVTAPAVSQSKPEASTSPLSQAQTWYKQGQYQKVLDLLRLYDSGGNGDANAQQSMILLLQSNQKLGYCQSVIQIGQRFATLFAQHDFAPEALYAVGQCQWQIQQRDIAKETWRNLVLRYPNTPAARRAGSSNPVKKDTP